MADFISLVSYVTTASETRQTDDRSRYPYDKKRLAKEVISLLSSLRAGTDQSDPVELTLGTMSLYSGTSAHSLVFPGIRRNGKPDILLPGGPARHLGRNVPPSSSRERHYSNDFESLSPFLFYSAEELAKKLATLCKKSTAKRFANQDGDVRGAFEHGRYVLSATLNWFIV